jgi:protein dithiol oxidoreductase (disulfide-forming)
VTTNRALILFATLLAGSWTLNACARTPDVAAAAATLSKWQAGTNYQLLASPQPTHVAAGKVQVAEIFWYGCGHCYALDPTLESWNADKPAYIEFVRVPVIWGAPHWQHAKLYYVLQALHRPELHAKVFDAIHQKGMPLAARDEVEARAMQLAFLSSQGVSEQDFNAAYDSMAVAASLTRAAELTKNYAIANVPTLVVAGKYSTNTNEAGGTAQMLSLINDLAASERKR